MATWYERPRVSLTLGLLVAIIAVGCTSDPDAETGEADAGTDAETVSSIEADTGEPEWSGAPVNPFDLRAGQCFNEVSWIDAEEERRINITARIDCAEPHDREVYFEEEFPAPNGAPFPGEVKMTEWSTELCYQAFVDFVGVEYELSRFDIDFLQPTEATFEHPVGRHRRVTCSLYDTSDEPMIGSARDSQA